MLMIWPACWKSLAGQRMRSSDLSLPWTRGSCRPCSSLPDGSRSAPRSWLVFRTRNGQSDDGPAERQQGDFQCRRLRRLHGFVILSPGAAAVGPILITETQRCGFRFRLAYTIRHRCSRSVAPTRPAHSSASTAAPRSTASARRRRASVAAPSASSVPGSPFRPSSLPVARRGSASTAASPQGMGPGFASGA